MHDTKMPRGCVQKMTTVSGNTKGIRSVLTERGINCVTLKKEDMIKILSQHDDFCEEKIIIELYLPGHHVVFFPTFHCELNSIEHVWAQAKHYTRSHCNHRISSNSSRAVY